MEESREDGFECIEDVFLGDEGHFEVELIEFAGRSVGTSIFIAEAGSDLEVSVESGDHEELFELLWGLG